MTAADALRRAEPWLQQCGWCDAGLTTSCTCPNGDPRGVISALVNALEHQAAETPDGAAYSLNFVWARQRVILHVHTELTPEQARDLALSLRWFAGQFEAAS